MIYGFSSMSIFYLNCLECKRGEGLSRVNYTLELLSRWRFSQGSSPGFLHLQPYFPGSLSKPTVMTSMYALTPMQWLLVVSWEAAIQRATSTLNTHTLVDSRFDEPRDLRLLLRYIMDLSSLGMVLYRLHDVRYLIKQRWANACVRGCVFSLLPVCKSVSRYAWFESSKCVARDQRTGARLP